jgi:5-methylcytosine-specific restriction enzyme subunit McrC
MEWLALIFDMNVLWEKWVLRQIQKIAPPEWNVSGQYSANFWTPDSRFGYSKKLRPDIIIETRSSKCILDTKWKMPKDNKPCDDDLKQMLS